MTSSDAINLIRDAVDVSNTAQRWTDLGAGSGTFTRALASLLDSESVVYAVDRDKQSLKEIIAPRAGAKIITLHHDFTVDNIDVPPLDGVLMANALHFVSDQYSFLMKMKSMLKPGGRMVIVEYDRRDANRWVPFPVPFDKLKLLTERVGFDAATRTGELPSVYDNAMMYAAVLTRENSLQD